MPPIRCPACTAEYSISSPQSEAACQYCGTRVEFAGLLCPICHHLSGPDSDICSNCGEAFTTFGRALLMQRDARLPPAWLEQTRGRALALKESSEIHSQARMKSFMDTENRRQAALRDARVARQAQDQRILLAAGVIVVALMIPVIILLVLLR